MKKKILSIALLLGVTGFVSAQNSASYNHVFADMGKWTVDNKPASNDGTTIPVAGSNSLSNGHLNVIMGAQNPTTTDHKYRADLKFLAALPADYITFNKTADVYLAIKFIGNRPSGSLKLELHEKTNNTYINNGGPKYTPSGSIQTANNNYIYYFKIDGDVNYAAGNIAIDQINFTLADGTVDNHYTVDWVATFTNLTDIQTYKNTKDDGVSDADESSLGVNEISISKNELSIYPNPSTARFFNIDLGKGPANDTVEVKVYGLGGNLVLKKTLNTNTTRIDHNLSTGVYIVKVGNSAVKLIVQ